MTIPNTRLPTEIEERLRQCEATVTEDMQAVDESLDEIDGLDFDDPSVVRAVESLGRTTERARRESAVVRLGSRKGA